MIFALRDSRGNEPLAIHLGPVRGSGARAFHARIAWLSTCVPLAHFKSTMIFALRDSRGNEPLAIHLGPVRGPGARAFHARDALISLEEPADFDAEVGEQVGDGQFVFGAERARRRVGTIDVCQPALVVEHEDGRGRRLCRRSSTRRLSQAPWASGR